MGYYTENGISCYEPDDTDNEFYLLGEGHYSLQDVINHARAKWGNDINLSDLNIYSQHIHTRSLEYDLYDMSDWNYYICVAK